MKRRGRILSAAALACSAGLAQAQIAENFNGMSQFDPLNPQGMTLAGWTFQNSANPPGGTGMYNGVDLQGTPLVFPAHGPTGFLAANYNNCTGTSTISTWAISPQVLLENGKVFVIYTRTVDFVAFPDRLQVRMSTAGASTNVGPLADPTAVGDFTNLLLDVNPTYTLVGYPSTWTEYVMTLSGLPVGGVQGRFAIRYFVEGGGPTGANSDFIGVDSVEYGTATTGACCFADGSCQVLRSAQCSNQGGIYAGDNVTCVTANCQPILGACCFIDGSCQFILQATCTSQNGTWSGANVTCATANCQVTGWIEQNEAGNLPSNAQIVAGSGTLAVIQGTLGAGDSDMYQFEICDEANFSASAVGGTEFDTQLWLFNPSGTGIAFNDDSSATLQSTVTSTFVNGNGIYLLAISGYDDDALDSGGQEIWIDTPFGAERQPDGPGAANPIASWSGFGDEGAYSLSLTGACFSSGNFGACCLGAPSYSCIITSQASCQSQGGQYAGNNVTCAAANCPPPPTGRCCFFDGSCQVLTQAACGTQNGVYGGNSTTCGSCPTPYAETGDAGDLPGTAQSVSGSGTLIGITGNLGVDDCDMFKIRICDEANFGASTVGLATFDTQLFLFNTAGNGVVMDDDAPGVLQSVLTSQFVTANGEYLLAVSQYNKDPQDSLAQLIWNNTNPGGAFQPEWAPNGPGAANPVAGWTANLGGTGGSYGIRLGGSCYVGGCYANCDGSTGTPVLTANDFQCFANAYAAGSTTANCDGSTGTPQLTANDFQCFANAYAAGCS